MEVDRSNIEIFKVGRTSSESHLAYADDVILFCKSTPRYLATIKRVLDDFSTFSGLKVNHEKSFIVFSSSVADLQVQVEILQLPTKSLPFQYLRVPITSRGIKHKDC